MSFFKKLFNKTADPAPSDPAPASASASASAPEQSANAAALFDQEFLATIPRYLSKPGIDVDLKMRHKETNEVMTFAAAFPEQFETWKTIQSLHDRRGLIYSILDSFMGKDLQLWQIIERFTDDRYPQRAFEIASAHSTDNDFNSADYWAAMAKTDCILTNYQEAERNARVALSCDAANHRAIIALADILHITGRCEEAHALYNEVLQARLPRNEALTLSFAQLVGFNGNILFSPIYALDWLKAHPDVTIDTWNWANDEFYFSPHFRAQFAYYLLKQKETMKGFVKLFNTAKEMPWFKEAVINSLNLAHQLGLAENMPDGIAWLNNIIQSNNWDVNDHGLHEIEL